MAQVLIVDDDSNACISLVRALKVSLSQHSFHAAGTAAQALKIQQEKNTETCIVDLCIDEKSGVQSGFDLIQQLLQTDPTTRIIVLTGHSSLEHGIEAMKRGAASFLGKPADIGHLSVLISDGIAQCEIRRLATRMQEHEESRDLMRLVGKSEKAKKIREELKFAAFSQQAVFISGESGTGKSLCASILHSLGKTREGRCIRYQPSFLSSDLVNSDLFGHQKGAFTGADSEKKGLIEEAHNGTLFLDEIDALPLDTQVLLLGVLQDKKYRRVGGTTDIQSHFRLISASNGDLQALVEKGTFRKDLFLRIAHLTITHPALRDRKEDIADLCKDILSDICTKNELSVHGIAPESLEKLEGYEWPGNVRELQSVLEGAAYRAQYQGRSEIVVEDIVFQNLDSREAGVVESDAPFHEKVAQFKLQLIRDALERNGGNQVQAARELKLDRTTLRRLMNAREHP